MQRAVQKKEIEIAKVSTENQSLQTEISTISENFQTLEQHLEGLQLESQLESSAMLDVTSSRVYLNETHTGSETDSLLVHEMSSATGTVGRTNPCQRCFQWGKCACCLFTVSIGV